jgi:hypothetical protein
MESENPADRLFSLVLSKTITQALGAVAQLKVADFLKDGPRAIAELAAQTGAHEQALYRVMRMLAGYGVFREIGTNQFELTDQGQLLRSDVSPTLREFAILFADPVHNAAYAEALHSVRTGGTAFAKTHGEEIFDYFTKDPSFFTVFNDAMTANSSRLTASISASYDFTEVNKLADVGGGVGFLLNEVLQRNPHLEGELFDLPEVVADAEAAIDAAGMTERITRTGGSFFDAIPVAADAYMLKHVIHDWSDEQSVQILSNCTQHMTRDGKVLVIEYIVPENKEPHVAKLLDMEMLFIAGGRERTQSEFEALFARAGLKLNDVITTDSSVSILESVRA